MDSSLVSVVTATYNRKELVVRAIKSVLNQTYKNWELWVVDDASTDDTEKAVKALAEKDKRIGYIKLAENFGYATRPRNVGIAVSKGKYIAYLDDDNTFHDNHLDVLVRGIKLTGADVVYGDREYKNLDHPNPPHVGVEHTQNCQDFDAEKLHQYNYIDTSDLLHTREAIDRVGGWDDAVRRMADWDLAIRLHRAGCKIERIPGVITDYWWHKQNYGQFRGGRIALFTLVKDRREYTRRMMASLWLNTMLPYDHFVLDNGSSDGSLDDLMLWHMTGRLAYYHHSDDNMGISRGSNLLLDRIMAMGCYDWIVKVDNDCEILTPRWLERCLRVMDKGTVLSPYVHGLVTHRGGAPRVGEDSSRGIGFTKHIGGIVTIAHRKAYEDFGRWKVPAPLHGQQDSEFSGKLVEMGYQFGYKEDVECLHIDGTQGQQDRYPQYFKLREQELVTVV